MTEVPILIMVISWGLPVCQNIKHPTFLGIIWCVLRPKPSKEVADAISYFCAYDTTGVSFGVSSAMEIKRVIE